jgi:hypothetical protein
MPEGAIMKNEISDFPARLAKPAQRALASAGYTHLQQLTRVSEAELLKLHGMGPKALRQLREALTEKGLSLFMLDDEIIKTVIRFNEALNGRDVATMMDLMTEDCLFENTYPPPDGTHYVGQAAVQAFWEEFFRDSSQAHFEIEEIFAGQNRCVMRWVYRWADQAGQPGYIRGVDIYKLSNSLIAEKLSYVKG